MAIFKTDGYCNNVRVETGDEEIDKSGDQQLQVSIKELVSAINAEALADKIFARLLTLRKKMFESLTDKLSGK